ncbi:MAG: hypothetical protein J6Q72_02195 [Clostridia bacterium]|nr:hypothetical protein [Clostridia bacterium]
MKVFQEPYFEDFPRTLFEKSVLELPKTFIGKAKTAKILNLKTIKRKHGGCFLFYSTELRGARLSSRRTAQTKPYEFIVNLYKVIDNQGGYLYNN